MNRTLSIGDTVLAVTGGPVSVARLDQEWYEDVKDPETLVEELRSQESHVDLFTFWQRVPDSEPHFPYFHESEEIAALPVVSFEDWWENRLKGRIRGLARKAEKKGVVIRECEFDDDFVKGMVGVFNETPVRQGRPFWHYGKDTDTVRREFSRYLFREDLIGAFLDGQMVGFVMLADAGNYLLLGQIISKIEHRDKAINNALIAKSVEICARKGTPFLVYNYWNTASLTEFKRRNGFEPVRVPRYFIPLTRTGRLALSLGLHMGLKAALPESLVTRLRDLRNRWYTARASAPSGEDGD